MGDPGHPSSKLSHFYAIMRFVGTVNNSATRVPLNQLFVCIPYPRVQEAHKNEATQGPWVLP